MPYRNRIAHLEESHRHLDKRIVELEKTHGDRDTIHNLKKQKLIFKDEINRMRKMQFEAERETVHWDE